MKLLAVFFIFSNSLPKFYPLAKEESLPLLFQLTQIQRNNLKKASTDNRRLTILQAHLGIDTGAGQFVLDDHHDDSEHPHDEGVVADAFPLLEKGLPPAEPVADVRFVLRARPDAARGALHLPAPGQDALVHVARVLRVDADKGDTGLLAGSGCAAATATSTAATPGAPHAAPAAHAAAVLHRPRDRECRHWLP